MQSSVRRAETRSATEPVRAQTAFLFYTQKVLYADLNESMVGDSAMFEDMDSDNEPHRGGGGPHVRCPLCLAPLDLSDLRRVSAHFGPAHSAFSADAEAQARVVRDQLQALLLGAARLN